MIFDELKSKPLSTTKKIISFLVNFLLFDSTVLHLANIKKSFLPRYVLKFTDTLLSFCNSNALAIEPDNNLPLEVLSKLLQ